MQRLETIPVTELHRELGATSIDSSRSQFCVWSPTTESVEIVLVDQDRTVKTEKTAGGYHVAKVDGVAAGDRYSIRLDGGPNLPDPASRFQPDGVHGPSMVGDPMFQWRDVDWIPAPIADWVIYEMHIGTFTQAGTFTAAIDRLDELVDLGINAIELMPVADAAGRWNWGYDGVNLFAPNRNYGTPSELKRLVDVAHRKGLAVILDVVYNHLGPEGNYLGQTGPYLSSRHHTVWGSAPNFDDAEHGDQLRRFFIANAVYWFDEFHVDGLRVDAIHCMKDDRPRHIVKDISLAVQTWSKKTGRAAMLIAESNVYDDQMTVSLDQSGCGFDGQWGDDFLHSLFAVVRPGEQLCHRTYEPGKDLDQVLRTGYVYAGTLAGDRGRCPPTDRVDTSTLIYSIQNHDFIGNHPLGQRLHQLTSLETQRAAAALLILGPAIPMLFMGEEFACEHPFAFFVDFGDDHLRQAVIEGRRREYPQHDWSGGASPTDDRAFFQSKIGPAEQGDPSMRNWYRQLIELRHGLRRCGLLRGDHLSVVTDLDAGVFVLTYQPTGNENTGNQHTGNTVTVAVRLCSTTEMDQGIPWSAEGNLVLDSRGQDADDHRLHRNHARVWTNVTIESTSDQSLSH